MWDEIISVMNIVSTKMTNTIAKNVSINSYDKEVRYKINCFILHTVLLVIILLLITTIICYHYAEHSSKQKSTNNLKCKIMSLKKFVLKIVRVIISMI